MSERPAIDFLAITSNVVSAYISNNSVPTADLPALLTQVYSAMTNLLVPPINPASKSKLGAEQPTPTQIRKSVTPDALISFIDGKPYKMLRRHLSGYGLTPDAYRARYGLPDDYPSIAENYSAARSAIAREVGLGRKRRKMDSVTGSVPVSKPATKPKRPSRARKVAEPA